MSSTPPLGPRADDPLWVPLLSHYTPDGGIDTPRMSAHLRSLAPHVRQIMLAGSTGDGWEMDDDRFEALLDFATGELAEDTQILLGALRPSTAEVIARIQHVERRLADSAALRGRFRGIVVCPPVDDGAEQDQIAAHYADVLAATRSDIAAYQLPQVTGCRMAPETLVRIAANPRITMLKDSSGEDVIAKSGQDFGTVQMVRGAEGGYIDALAPRGPYHGWLLSTGNALAAPLRHILELEREGKTDDARAQSSALSDVVAQVFDAAAQESGANAFSNANRAMDHLRAYGARWQKAPPPRKLNGELLSRELLDRVSDVAGTILDVGSEGYIHKG